MDPVTGQQIRPGHPLWESVHAAALAHAANQGPLLISRTNQVAVNTDIHAEIGRIAQEGVEETIRSEHFLFLKICWK